MTRVYDDTVPEVDAKPGDDDAAIAKWARQHRTRMGYRFLSAAGIAVTTTIVSWLRTEAEGSAALVIWGLGGACTIALAIAGVWKLVTPPGKKKYPDW